MLIVVLGNTAVESLMNKQDAVPAVLGRCVQTTAIVVKLTNVVTQGNALNVLTLDVN
jgi:uracil-DNA glycosylase